jgi:hypothetical protein
VNPDFLSETEMICIALLRSGKSYKSRFGQGLDIIKAYDGEIKVETPPAGRAGKESEGAKFIVHLPVV